MAQRDDAPLADEPQPGSVPNDMPEGGSPSGLPEGGDEPNPLGADAADPDGEGDAPRGGDAMPGIPEKDEPYTGG